MTHPYTSAASSETVASPAIEAPSSKLLEPSGNEAYLALLGHMAEAALLLDANGLVLYCNARLPELLGCGALKGRALSDNMLPYNLSEWSQRLANGLVATTQYEFNFMACDGTVMPMSLLTTPTKHQGRPAIAIVVTPTSPIKAAVPRTGPITDFCNVGDGNCSDELEPSLGAEELWQLNQRYKAALVHAHVSMFEQDLDLRYQWIFNPTFVRGSDAMIGKTSADFFDESCATQLDQFRREVVVSGEPMRREVTLLGKEGGRTRYFEMHMEPLRGPAGQIKGVRSVVIDIEERKQFELRLLNIFSNSPTAIAISRVSDAVFVDVNAAFLAIHGYSRDEIIGHTSAELKLWNNADACTNRMTELKKSKPVTNFTSEYRHKSGRIGHVLATVGLMKIGGEDHVIGFLNDITEMAQVHEEVRQSEAKFRLLASATFEGIGIVKSGVILEINEQMTQILGYPEHEVIGQPVQRFIAADYLDKARAQLAKGGESKSEYDFIQKDGTRIKVEVRSCDFRRGDEVLRLSVIRDVTQGYRAQESLRQAQARLQSLMDSNIVGVEISSLDGQIFEANDYKLNLLRRTRQDLEAGLIRWTDYSSEKWKAETEQARLQVRQHGKCMPFEREYHFDDGTAVPVMIALSLLPGPGEKVIAITLDISPIKRIESELAQTNAKLLQRTTEAESAIVAKTRFLSTVSHELRTPLHTILGYVRLMRKEAVGEVLSQLSIVDQNSTRLLQLIDDLLDFNLNAAQSEVLQLEWMEVDTLLGEVEHQGCISAKSGNNSFVIHTAGDIPANVLTDEKRLLQIVRNLVSNACKYTRNGNVTVLLNREPALKAEYSESACRIQFSVRDTGRGIAPQDLHRIFEPFVRGHGTEDQPGIGLGLAVASQWVRNMGGELTVQSVLDEGSCFSFTLDVICAEGHLSPKVAPPFLLEGCQTYKQALGAVHPCVLLVDDNEANRSYLSAVCKGLGYNVVHASSGEQALLRCQSAKQPFIAALIDQMMPMMSGWELLKWLRQTENFGTTASVLISASPPCRPANFPSTVNFDLMLTKPFNEQVLMCFLCHCLPGVRRTAENCWHLQKNLAQTNQVALPEHELQVFRALLGMGRLLGINEWARRLANQNEYANLSTQVIRFAESADVLALANLLVQLEKSSLQIPTDNQGMQ